MTQKLLDSPSVAETSDSDLILASLQGNPASFGDLIERHQPAIFLMVHRHLRQREEAEDVAQQVFVQAFRNLGQFRGEAKFFTWLYTIALNLVRNHVRQRNIRRTSSLDGVSDSETSRGPQWPDRSPSIEEVVHHRWELARVQDAVEKLQDLQRAIFTLHYFQNFPLKDVAVRVGRPVGTVKVYLHRARKLVLAQLESEEKSSHVTSPPVDASN